MLWLSARDDTPREKITIARQINWTFFCKITLKRIMPLAATIYAKRRLPKLTTQDCLKLLARIDQMRAFM